ncbi:enoyl-ACP reductase [candidate division KSB1 bacterium]|nr:MAG: enoyl-ACP reductase [candidate division KSB1 bacterium]MBC6946428.1 enoyl-ACP reductase [candidate division KSB1 bacterium]MCE7942385.1 enoyl-ACP reductase [Chlorobi bacterium CHB1]
MSQKSYNLLQGKKGIIFGPLDDKSIAWHIALAAYREGARFALSNVKVAFRMGTIAELGKQCGDAPLIACDASSSEDIEAAFKELLDKVGKIDFIVHSIGMSQNVRKDRPYHDLNYEFFHKTLDVSAMSLHRIIAQALKAEALNDGGSIVALSYIGAQRTFSSYSDMGDAKALLESIARSFGSRLGKRGIRVNTVSQSPTKTTAGSGIDGFDALYDFAEKLSPLGNATAQDCADYVVSLLSDLTRKVTMQNLFNDGGFSTMGISDALMEALYGKKG